MRFPAVYVAILAFVVIGHPPPSVAQINQQRAQEYFKEAQTLSERDRRRVDVDGRGGMGDSPRSTADYEVVREKP